MSKSDSAKSKKTPRQEMPVQDNISRRSNFSEVALGYNERNAREEAKRCLQCKKPLCVKGCPVGVPIPQFILSLREGDIEGAVRIMKKRNNLPAVSGRVCPQERQCEGSCTLGKTADPVAIGRLERFVGDFELTHRTCPVSRSKSTGKKVAVVGSGPSGLTCAVDLAQLGHEVTIFESLHVPGGVLVYGIPEFRLPKDLVGSEIAYAVECLGIEIRTDHIIGRTITIEELRAEYDAVFLGTGAGLPSFLGIPGINLNGVMSANEFLTRVNLMKAYRFPEYDTPVNVGRRVAVIGAGNVAMDAARCSLRLQSLAAYDSPEVHIVYRRSEKEVPARKEEYDHAREEGILFDFLTGPVEIIGDVHRNVAALRCIRMSLGKEDPSGRRTPEPVPGSEFELEANTVIMALGTSPNPLVFSGDGKLERRKEGTIVANQDNGRTTQESVWAGGDIVTGSATVISAMGAGKRAAADIHGFLSS